MPNTLTQLNQFSDSGVRFEDQRPYSITFSANAAANTSTSIAEDQTFVVPTGIDITNVISQPGNITYTVTASGIGNVVGSWPSPLPVGVSNTSSGNTFRITGSFNSDTWNVAKNLSLNVPDREENFSVVGNITYPNPSNVSANSSWSWTNNVVVTSTNQDWTNITLPRTYVKNNYDPLFTANVPAISDDSGNTYVVKMTTSANIGMITLSDNLVSPGDWSYANRTFEFSGNRNQVNSMLGNVRFIAHANTTSAANISLVSTTTPDDEFSTTFPLTYQLATHLYKPELDISYNEDQTTPVVDGANIALVRTTTHWSEPWAVVISQQVNDNPVNNLAKLSGTGWSQQSGLNPAYPQAIYRSTPAVTTLSALLDRANTFTTVNPIEAAPDAAVDYQLRVETGAEIEVSGAWLSTPEVFIRGVFVDETHDDFNFPVTGTYTENTLVAMPNPLITDLDPTVSTDPAFNAFFAYITQESGADGAFFVNGSQTPIEGRLAFTSNPPGVQMANVKSNINSYNIEFMPPVNSTEPVVLRYQQYKSNALSGNVAQANVTSTYTGTAVEHITNMTSRTFVDRETNSIFASSTPEITDGSERGQTYTITLSSDVGKFGNSVANALAASSYTFTGNRSQCNTEFSNMVFVPNAAGPAGNPVNNTFTYTQTRSGTTQVSQTVALTKTGAATISRRWEIANTTSTYSISDSEALYGEITVVTIAGGGGGSGGGNEDMGGGGGGGQVTQANLTRVGGNIQVVAGNITAVVGDGGALGVNGGNSYVISNSVVLVNSVGGGAAGVTGVNYGGNSGSGRLGGIPGNHGGGGGAGYSAPFPDGIPSPGSSRNGGDGESGTLVDLDIGVSGYSVFHGGGGGGGWDGSLAIPPGRVGNGSRRSARGGGGYGNAQPGLANSGGGGGAGAAGGSGRVIIVIS